MCATQQTKPLSPTDTIAEVTRDYEAKREEFTSNVVGTTWSMESVNRAGHFWMIHQGESVYTNSPPDTTKKVQWKLYDDDNNLMYGGWLYDDPECVTQMAILSWGGYDAGCTTLKIKNPQTKKWEQVIG